MGKKYRSTAPQHYGFFLSITISWAMPITKMRKEKFPLPISVMMT